MSARQHYRRRQVPRQRLGMTAGSDARSTLPPLRTARSSGSALPLGAYVLMARVRMSNYGDGEEGALNCSIGVPGQLTATETDVNRVLNAGRTSLVVVGVHTSASAFTAFLNCAGDRIAIEAGTSLLAIKLGSLAVQ